MSEMHEMSDMYKDVLRELGNIGAGNAVTSISKLLSRRVDMAVPNVQLLNFNEIATCMGGPTNIVIGILVKISGDIDGLMIFCIEQKTAHLFINVLLGENYESYADFQHMEMSLLQEIGNIVTGSYIGSLAMVTNLYIRPSVPGVSIDMAGAILSVPAIEYGKLSDQILFIDTVFNTDDGNVSGYFLLVPDEESFDTIMKSLGV